ncbi:MAG: YqeG family HAD IIIA-type phosphatase [Lachnospiraceae bacterium]|nr:YqeG family HAD IIIA-type phosphatase [Lachnospiraceae bacterium]
MKYLLFPNDYVDSTYIIDFKKLYEEGYRGVIFDIDNTLVPHNAPADDRAKALFKELHDTGFQAMVLSNNKEPRVKTFSDAVIYCDYIYKAGKPNPGKYFNAMKLMGTDTKNTIFVGDQILTDIWGANRAGIRTCMVKPVLKWKEEPQIILKRLLEYVILFFYGIYRRHGKGIRPVPVR